MSKWKQHKSDWSNCTECELCETRNKTVLFKGKIPCDILFVGEAPGVSENAIGKPFVGPAGKLLDRIIASAIHPSMSLGFTNLIACIPLDPSNGNKLSAPHEEHISACRNRLLDIIKICNPKAIVLVGKLAETHCPKTKPSRPQTAIVHPAAILRADASQQGLAEQRAAESLSELVEQLTSSQS